MGATEGSGVGLGASSWAGPQAAVTDTKSSPSAYRGFMAKSIGEGLPGEGLRHHRRPSSRIVVQQLSLLPYTALVPKISAPTVEQHRIQTIDRLLEAWGQLVMRRGYADVSLADVASKAGLARTAIYGYFPDREALLFAWTDREVRRTIQALEHEVDSAPSSPAKLRVFIHMQLTEFTNRHLPPGQEVVQFLSPDTYRRFMDHIEPLEKILFGIINEGLEREEFLNIDPYLTVPLIIACIGAERLPLATKAHNVDEATDRLTTFLLRALGAAEETIPKKTAASKSKSARSRKSKTGFRPS